MDGEESKEVSKPQESNRPLVPYPFVRGKYGLNLHEKESHFRKGRIETGSGRKVMADMVQRSNTAWIRIYDEDEPAFTMQANVHGKTASADIYTRKQTGERHPDFFARNFLVFALNHFKNEGYPVVRFEAKWILTEGNEWGSDNYQEFQKLLQEGLGPEEAARLTWTGKVLSELGFSEVESIKRSDDEVIAFFKRPGTEPLV
ncbi:MAG: hypothetical protein HYT08_03085 [Candidatus Levybacteria bacterium]|nr:hypothetical protein [Candidatus Levybacteria bacterium]